MKESIKELKNNISGRFVGKDSIIHNIVAALLAGGHVLIEDVPGVGKTTLAKTLAGSIEAGLSRIQFTPDTLPTDIVGTTIFSAENNSFQTVKGPIFNQIILADEINRTSPRTQSALLEAMEERQVTIDRVTYPLPELFMVIATQNPSEQYGTYPLPEAELDRFMMKLSIGYPNMEMQMTMAKHFMEGMYEEAPKAVLSAEQVVGMMKEVKQVTVSDEVTEYALTIVDETRSLEELEYGLSPRAGLDLLQAARANAYMNDRDFVVPDDIIRMSGVVLPHRLVLTAKARMNRYTGQQLIIGVTDRVKRPK